jgi:hypothetical protein
VLTFDNDIGNSQFKDCDFALQSFVFFFWPQLYLCEVVYYTVIELKYLWSAYSTAKMDATQSRKVKVTRKVEAEFENMLNLSITWLVATILGTFRV